MKLLYMSCHSVLEWDEVSLFADLGIDVFSWGAYRNPAGHSTLSRPGIEKLNYYPEFEKLTGTAPKTNIPQELIDWADAILVMGGVGDVEIITENWPRIKHKKIIWRTIGQSFPWQERIMKTLKEQGLKIVRYSPKEKNLPDYCGADETIRFYKDEAEYTGWTGSNQQVINITQSLRGRGRHCFYDLITQVFSGFPGKIFGPGNDDLGNLNGGDISYDELKGQLRNNRVYFYTGTFPASYSLSFIEAMLTGIPIVGISKRLFMEHFKGELDCDIYEVPDILRHGDIGYIADNVNEARSYIKTLLDNGDIAAKMSEKCRRRAIDLFSKGVAKDAWKKFFEKICP